MKGCLIKETNFLNLIINFYFNFFAKNAFKVTIIQIIIVIINKTIAINYNYYNLLIKPYNYLNFSLIEYFLINFFFIINLISLEENFNKY